ncbi:MAG: ABC transporter ATP-binding protein, partial [Peptococcaceae bacterium]|nr:ABC transporter ATP-binding protein [Peptococcaceae bacterium]
MKVFKRLFLYVIPHCRLVITTFISMLSILVLGLLPPLILRTVVDIALPSGALDSVAWLVASYILVNLLLGVSNYGQWYSFELLGQRMARDLQLDLHNHLQRMHLEYFRKQKTGDIMSRVTEDVSSLNEFMGWGAILLVSNALTVLVTIGVMLWLNWQFTVAAVAVFPLLGFVVVRFDKRIRPIWTRVREEMSKLTTVLQENVSGVRTVKAFARESYEVGKFGARNKGFLGVNLERIKVESNTQPFIEFLSSLAIISLLWYGGGQVASDRISLGTLIAFQGYIFNLVWPTRMLGMLLNLMEQALAATPRLFEILDTPSAIIDAPSSTTAPEFAGTLEFKDVTFQFSDGDNEVL